MIKHDGRTSGVRAFIRHDGGRSDDPSAQCDSPASPPVDAESVESAEPPQASEPEKMQSEKTRLVDKPRPTRKTSPLGIVKMLPIDDIARESHSWDDFVLRIDQALDGSDVEYQRVTNSPNLVHGHFTGERVAFTYALLHGDDLPACVDRSVASLVARARVLDRSLFELSDGYDSKKVRGVLGCWTDYAQYITELWEVERYFKDEEHELYDFDYAWTKVITRELLEGLYACHTNCTEEEARAAVESYTLEKMRTLAERYPDWEAEADRRGEPRMVLRLPEKDRRSIWMRMPHPFFERHARDGESRALSAVKFFDHFDTRSPSPFWIAYGYEDRIEYGNYGAIAIERPDEFRITYSESFSYHDGGGGYTDSFVLAYAPDVGTLAQSSRRFHADTYEIPECMGYWDEGGTRYLVDPFGLEGVFSYTVDEEQWDSGD